MAPRRGLILVLLVLAGCGGSSPGQHPATISGTLVEAGGPAGAAEVAIAGTVVLDSGQLRYSAHAGTDGRWSIKVAPGTYVIIGTPQGSTAACPGSALAAISGSTVPGVKVVCPIK